MADVRIELTGDGDRASGEELIYELRRMAGEGRLPSEGPLLGSGHVKVLSVDARLGEWEEDLREREAKVEVAREEADRRQKIIEVRFVAAAKDVCRRIFSLRLWALTRCLPARKAIRWGSEDSFAHSSDGTRATF